MKERRKEGMSVEAVVVTTENGLVLTDNKIDALEAKLMRAVRLPVLMALLVALFVFVAAMGTVLVVGRLAGRVDDIDDKVLRIDAVASQVNSPESQAAQAKVIQDLTRTIDCNNREALQATLDALARQGLVDPAIPKVLTEKCAEDSP